MLGANAKSLGQDGTETALFTDQYSNAYELKVEEVGGLKTLSLYSGVSNAVIDCEVDYDRGTAYGTASAGYTPTILTSDDTAWRTDQLSRYSKDSKLAFFCGLKLVTDDYEDLHLKIDDGKGAVHKDDRLLIELDGTGDCTAQFNSEFTKVDTESDADSRLYKPKLKAKIEYRNTDGKLCIMKKDLAHGDVKATLNLIRTSEAATHNIVGNMVTTSSAPMTRTDEKRFEAVWDATFDLGANDPHSVYYESADGCADDAKCKGKIKFEAHDVSRDVSTALVTGGNGWKDDTVIFSGMSAAQCDQTPRTQSPGITAFKACGLSQVDSLTAGDVTDGRADDKGLLTAFKCPFKEGNTISTPAKVRECVREGRHELLSNKCADAGTNSTSDDFIARPKDLENGYVVQQKFDDASFRKSKPSVTLTQPAAQIVPHNKATVDWVITIGGDDVSHVQGLRVESGTFKQYVQVKDGKIKITGAPAESLTFDLKGATKLRHECKWKDDTLKSVNVTVTPDSSEDSGEFEMKDDNGDVSPCLGMFKYSGYGTPTKTVSGIHAPIDGLQKNVALLFCNDGETPGECRAKAAQNPASRSDKITTQYVIIDGACDNVHAGDVGALIEFEDIGDTKYQSAPVICPGTCQSGDLGSVVLDWSIDFGLDIQNDVILWDTVVQENNYLRANESSTYKGLKHGEKDTKKGVNNVAQTTYLAPNDQCSVDGKVYGSAATGCTVSNDGMGSLHKATDFVQKFKDCGNTQSDHPSVHLISSFVVELIDGSFLHFCNDKVLSIDIENMRGESTDSIGIIAEEATASDPISAQFSFIGYKSCELDGGQGHQLVATMDIDSNSPDFTISYGFGDVFAQLEDGKANAPVYDKDTRVLTFSTVCADICSAEDGAYDDQYGLDVTLRDTRQGYSTTRLEITSDIQVTGSPCGASDTLERGSVELDLYGVLSTSGDCDSTNKVADDTVNAKSHKLCASLNVDGFGSSSLSIVEETLTRTSPGAEPEPVTETTFFNSSYTNIEINTLDLFESSSAHSLDVAADSMKTYTLTVVWEQALSRRLLRTTHVFGAGEKSARSSIFILPASAQIEDAAGSLDAKSEEDEPASEEEEKKASGLSELAIGLIAGGIALFVLAVGYFVWKRVEEKRQGSTGGETGALGYMPVRRSERFSTMNF